MKEVTIADRRERERKKERKRGRDTETRVEAGSNTSTVTLRVVGGDDKRSFKFETVKYGRVYQGTQNPERLRWQGPAAYTKDRTVLSSEMAPHKKQDRNCQNSNKYLVSIVCEEEEDDDFNIFLSVPRSPRLCLSSHVRILSGYKTQLQYC
jgi:hypothetical protein